MARITTEVLFNLMNDTNSEVKALRSEVAEIKNMLSNGVAVTGKKEVAKAPAKGKSKSTKGKAKSSGSFDRAAYEATAKKLGVWNEEYGKVTGTWKDGKKVADAKTNRAKVYAAMGIK